MNFRVAEPLENWNKCKLTVVIAVIFKDNRHTAQISVLVRRSVYESSLACTNHEIMDGRNDALVIISEGISFIYDIFEGNILCKIFNLILVTEFIGILKSEREIRIAKKLKGIGKDFVNVTDSVSNGLIDGFLSFWNRNVTGIEVCESLVNLPRQILGKISFVYLALAFIEEAQIVNNRLSRKILEDVHGIGINVAAKGPDANLIDGIVININHDDVTSLFKRLKRALEPVCNLFV